MPQNKNAITRYIILDRLLQHKFGHTIKELTELCNDELGDKGYENVTKHCIEKDLIAMEEEPFYAEIDRLGTTPIEDKKYQDAKLYLSRKMEKIQSIMSLRLKMAQLSREI